MIPQVGDDHRTLTNQLSIHKKVAAVVFLVCVVFLHVLTTIAPLQRSIFVFPGSRQKPRRTDLNDSPTSSPLHGYVSLGELNERSLRFPSILERVNIYMSSHWFHPPCSNNNDGGDLVLYRLNNATVDIREIARNHSWPQRLFRLDSSTALRKIHAMQRDTIISQECSSEYCQDLLQFWFPVVDSLGAMLDPMLPFLFQFSDEEVSIAFEPRSGKNISYPNLPHVKKMRLALPLNTSSYDETPVSYCASVGRLCPSRLQPSKLCLPTKPI